jgi:tripartite-type tricarboxylate transporter receptor subunit TctC
MIAGLTTTDTVRSHRGRIMISRRQSNVSMLAALFCASLPFTAAAQDFPARPIRLVVPYPPGGPTDVAARIIANAMAAKLGQPLVVENRPGGAAGTVGGRYVASADPDGYTLVMSQVGSLTVAPFLYKLDYDPIKDFAPIGIAAETPEILTINPSLPANTVAEFVAYAKNNPGKLDFASPGVGTLPHLLGEQLQLAAGIKLTHVPYRGAGPAVSDLLGGQVQVMFDSTSVMLPHIQAGHLRALAISSAKRIAQIPNVPTVTEAGYAQLTESLWTALLAPAATPEPIIQKLNKALNESVKTPDVQKAYANLDVVTRIVTPQELKTFMAEEVRKWQQLVAQAGIKGE